jgi:hypothetical protein
VDRDEVEHDCADDLEDAEPRTQESGNTGYGSTGGSAGEKRQTDHRHPALTLQP